MMVCLGRKIKEKFHIYFNGRDMGEVEPYIETDEDVRIVNLLYSKWLLTPPPAIVFNRLGAVRGFYAVRPLIY